MTVDSIRSSTRRGPVSGSDTSTMASPTTGNGILVGSTDNPQDTNSSLPKAPDQVGNAGAKTTSPADNPRHLLPPARNDDAAAAEELVITSSSTSEDAAVSDASQAAASDAGEMMMLQLRMSTMMEGKSMSEAQRTCNVKREKPKRTKRRVRGDTTCGVCGDRAIAHNFGALTCETCKAFFRRNATKKQELPTCQFNRTCTITKNTRRFCASCRMEKCFAIGMDPLLILERSSIGGTRVINLTTSPRTKQLLFAEAPLCPELPCGGPGEEEKKTMRARRQERQKQREEVCMQVDSSAPSESVLPDCSSSSWHQVTFSPAECVELPSHPSLDAQASMPAAVNHCDSDSNMNPAYLTRPFGRAGVNSSANADCKVSQSAREVTTTSCPSQIFEPFLAQGRRFRHVERDQLPWDIKLYWLLSEEERYLLTSLTTSYTAIQISLEPPLPSDNFHPNKPLSVDNLMFILEATLRKSVHFAKTIPDFKNLSETDQIAILKASALESYALRSAALFIVERNAWNSYLGDLQLKDIQKVFEDHTIVDVFANFCGALKSVVKANSTIYALLHCITLFDVRNTKLEDAGKVSAIQDRYFVLLKHYLESEYSYLHAGRYMAELMTLLEDMHKHHHRVVFFYKQFSSFFRPLISEFFNV